jgi:hypothetical protein
MISLRISNPLVVGRRGKKGGSYVKNLLLLVVLMALMAAVSVGSAFGVTLARGVGEGACEHAQPSSKAPVGFKEEGPNNVPGCHVVIKTDDEEKKV